MNFLPGETYLQIPKEGKERVIELDIKKPGKQRITISSLLGWGADSVRVELMDDASKVKSSKPMASSPSALGILSGKTKVPI